MRECRLFAASITITSYNDDDKDKDKDDDKDDDDKDDINNKNGNNQEKLLVTGGISLTSNKILSSVEVFNGNSFEIDESLTLPMPGNF
jgi:hypothetical protein